MINKLDLDKTILLLTIYLPCMPSLICISKEVSDYYYYAFIDYRKAFDFIERVSLWDKMIAMGINGNILHVIYHLYHKVKSCVRVNGNLSYYFSCNDGVRQGENLSPLFFFTLGCHWCLAAIGIVIIACKHLSFHPSVCPS